MFSESFAKTIVEAEWKFIHCLVAVGGGVLTNIINISGISKEERS